MTTSQRLAVAVEADSARVDLARGHVRSRAGNVAVVVAVAAAGVALEVAAAIGSVLP